MNSSLSGRPAGNSATRAGSKRPSGVPPAPWIVRSSELTFVPASHEDPSNPGCLKKVLARRDDLPEGRIQMLNWTLLPCGKRFAEHYHEDMLEVFVIVSGTVEVVAENGTQELSSGDAWFVPPGIRHQMSNRADKDALYVVFGIASEHGGKTVVTGGS